MGLIQLLLLNNETKLGGSLAGLPYYLFVTMSKLLLIPCIFNFFKSKNFISIKCYKYIPVLMSKKQSQLDTCYQGIKFLKKILIHILLIFYYIYQIFITTYSINIHVSYVFF